MPEYAIDKMFDQMQIAYKEIQHELPKGHVIDIVAIDKSKKEEVERE